MESFHNHKERKSIILFLLSELDNQDRQVRNMITTLFTNPQKYKISLALFNHDELFEIQHNLHSSVLKIMKSDDLAEEYIRNLLKVEEILTELPTTKLYLEPNRIRFMLDLVIDAAYNPTILKFCLIGLKKEILSILQVDCHTARLRDLIKSLFFLIFHPNEDVRDYAFELLQLISYSPSFEFIQNNESYIAFREKREKNLKDIVAQIQISSLSRIDEIEESFNQLKAAKKEIKSILSFLLEEILKAENQNQAELVLRLSSDDHFQADDYACSQNDDNRDSHNKMPFLAKPEVIVFFCNIYTRCRFTYLQYVAMENLKYSLTFLYKNRNYIISDILYSLANLKISSEYLEIIEQSISFFDMVATELPALKECALLCLERLLLNNPHFILIKSREDVLPFLFLNNTEESLNNQQEQVSKHKLAINCFLAQQYEKSINLYKSLLSISDSDKLLYLIELAHCHWQVKHLDEARRIFNLVIAHHAQSGYAHFQRGVFLFESGLDYTQSENDLIKASELNDFYAPIYYYRALISERAHRDISAAISHLDMALALRPAYRQALDKKIELYYRQSDYVMARIVFHEAQNYFSNFSEFPEGRAQAIVRDTELVHIPYAEEFNYISTLLKRIDDPFWSKVEDVLTLAQKIIDELEKFVSDDILEDCNIYYPLQDIGKEDLQPHERYRFMCDFISLVIRRTVWFEFHQRYQLFQDKSERTNLVNLIRESQVGNIFNEKRPSILLERLSQYCAVYSMHDFLKKHLVSAETRDGYAVGITKDLAKTYSIFPRILGLHHWEAAYGMYDLAAENAHTEQFFKSILATNKKVIFFVPTAIGNDAYKEKVTYEEVAWVAKAIRDCPQLLKNLIIVFDAYNFLPLYLLSRQLDEESLGVEAEKLLEEVKQFLLNYVVTANEHTTFMEVYHKNIGSYLNRNIKGFLLSQVNYSALPFRDYANKYHIQISDLINELKQLIIDTFNYQNLPLSGIKITVFYTKLKKLIEHTLANRERFLQRKISLDFILKLLADKGFSNFINPDDTYLDEVIYFLENAQDIIADENSRILMKENLIKLIDRYENNDNLRLKKIINAIKLSLKSGNSEHFIPNKEVIPAIPRQPIGKNYKKNQPILISTLTSRKITLKDAKTQLNISVDRLIKAFDSYSHSVKRVKYGLFAGEIPRHLREIKQLTEQIFKHPEQASVSLDAMAKIVSNHGNFCSMLKLISQCQQAFAIYEQTKSKSIYYQILEPRARRS